MNRWTKVAPMILAGVLCAGVQAAHAGRVTCRGLLTVPNVTQVETSHGHYDYYVSWRNVSNEWVRASFTAAKLPPSVDAFSPTLERIWTKAGAEQRIKFASGTDASFAKTVDKIQDMGNTNYGTKPWVANWWCVLPSDASDKPPAGK